MVSNETIEAINYVKDIDFEYNIKLITLLLMAGFCLLSIWYFRNRFEVNNLAGYFVKEIIEKSSWTFLVTSPLWVSFLARTVDYDVIIRFIMFLYGLGFVVGMFWFFTYGSEKIYNFFTGKSFYDKNWRRK